MKNLSNPKKVLHIIDSLACGGAQQFLYLTVTFSSESYSHIVCALQPPYPTETAVEIPKAQVICLNRKRPSITAPHQLLFYIFSNFRNILRLCHHHGIQVIHCHLSDAEFIGIPAGLFFGAKKILSTVHITALLPQRSRWSFRNFLRRLIMVILYRQTDHVIAVAKEVSHQLQQVFSVPPHKIKTMINRIDTNNFKAPSWDKDLIQRLNLHPKRRVITTVARFDPLKGHVVLIKSIELLKPRRGQLLFVWAGDGCERSCMTEHCTRCGLEDMLVFLGTYRNIPALLSLTDIFVLPSFFEATSLALLEAMAAGKAIIATDIPGNSALLKNGENALLVPPGDPDALAQAITFLLDNPETAALFGQLAQKMVREQYDIRENIQNLEKLWD